MFFQMKFSLFHPCFWQHQKSPNKLETNEIKLEIKNSSDRHVPGACWNNNSSWASSSAFSTTFNFFLLPKQPPFHPAFISRREKQTPYTIIDFPSIHPNVRLFAFREQQRNENFPFFALHSSSAAVKQWHKLTLTTTCWAGGEVELGTSRSCLTSSAPLMSSNPNWANSGSQTRGRRIAAKRSSAQVPVGLKFSSQVLVGRVNDSSLRRSSSFTTKAARRVFRKISIAFRN